MPEAKGNGTWMKVSLCIMGAITLFSTGWAASSTTVCVDYQRLDAQGTQKAQQLETRVAVLEKTVEQRLGSIDQGISEIKRDLRSHVGGVSAANPGQATNGRL